MGVLAVASKGDMEIMNADCLNHLAMEHLEDEDSSKAQFYFRQNRRKNPCYISYQNLGFYYVSEGMFLKSGKTQIALKLGLKYLKKAESFTRTYENVMAIGKAFYRLNNCKSASDYYRIAITLKEDCLSLNNLGASLYHLNEYKDASYISKAIEKCTSSKDANIISDKPELYSSYAFSLLRFDKNKSHKVLKQILEKDFFHIEIDEFTIAYLCGDFQLAGSLCPELFKKWHLQPPDIAMVLDCFYP